MKTFLAAEEITLEQLKNYLELFKIKFIDSHTWYRWPEGNYLVHSFQFPKAVGHIRAYPYYRKNTKIEILDQEYSTYKYVSAFYENYKELHVQGNLLIINFKEGILFPPEVKISKKAKSGTLEYNFLDLDDDIGKALAFDALNYKLDPSILYDYLQDLIQDT